MQIDNTYHGESPNWRNSHYTKTGELIGIELEVEHPTNRQIAADALDGFKRGKYPAPIAERDGSLNPVLGVEIVCPPIPTEEAKSEDGYIARLMRALADSGARTEQPAGYGMHVNINVVDWEPKDKVIVQYLLNRFRAFGSAIGRRAGSRHGSFGEYIPTLSFQRVAGGRLAMNTYPGDKHCAAWVRAPGRGQPAGGGAGMVLEVRFPKSSLNITDLRNVIDYVHAVRDWVRAARNHTAACIFYDFIMLNTVGTKNTVLLQGLFLHWLSGKRPELYDLLVQAGGVPVAGKRLAVMQDAIAKIKNPNLGVTRLTTHGNADHSEQTLRIGALLSKGAELQGEQDYNGTINAPSVRTAR